jgi:hypothetical protein
MIKIIYTVKFEKKQSEISWLKMQGICPATEDELYWPYNEPEPTYRTKIGIIVDNDAALAIKLRHNLDLQLDYRQK